MSPQFNPFETDLECDLPENCLRSKFVHPLTTVMDNHMRAHVKLHSIETLIEFCLAQDVKVSKQAVYSALMTLMRQGKVFREHHGAYKHASSLSPDGLKEALNYLAMRKAAKSAKLRQAAKRRRYIKLAEAQAEMSECAMNAASPRNNTDWEKVYLNQLLS